MGANANCNWAEISLELPHLMKVSIIVGGRWHAFDLAKELQQAGVLHRLITTYPKFKTRQWSIPDEKVVSLPASLLLERLIHKIGKDHLVSKYQYFLHQTFAHLAAHYLKGSDVIHGWSGFSLPALKWAKENGVPFVLERSSSHMLVQCQLLQKEYDRLGLTWAATHPKVVEQDLKEYNLADRVAVPSLFVKRGFLDQGFNEERLIYNPFGTNLKSFFPGEKQDNTFRVVYAGALSVRKGVYYLVQAFQEAGIPNSELCLVGGASAETPRLLAQADERVKCMGHVPQSSLVKYYQNSSVFVMASIDEGMAMVQLQALACGLPLICTTNTGGEDLLRLSGEPTKLGGGIEEYPAGYLVPACDSRAISQCLKLLADDPKLLSSKREAALSIRDTDLGWETYAKRAIDSYKVIALNS